jgi:hypothetical protein
MAFHPLFTTHVLYNRTGHLHYSATSDPMFYKELGLQPLLLPVPCAC